MFDDEGNAVAADCPASVVIDVPGVSQDLYNSNFANFQYNAPTMWSVGSTDGVNSLATVPGGNYQDTYNPADVIRSDVIDLSATTSSAIPTLDMRIRTRVQSSNDDFFSARFFCSGFSSNIPVPLSDGSGPLRDWRTISFDLSGQLPSGLRPT